MFILPSWRPVLGPRSEASRQACPPSLILQGHCRLISNQTSLNRQLVHVQQYTQQYARTELRQGFKTVLTRTLLLTSFRLFRASSGNDLKLLMCI